MHLKSMNQNSGTLDHLLIMISQKRLQVRNIEIQMLYSCTAKINTFQAYLMNIDDFDNLFLLFSEVFLTSFSRINML